MLCMHPLLYYQENVTLKTIEWLELLRIMKFDKVVMPYFHLEESMIKILRWVSYSSVKKSSNN